MLKMSVNTGLEIGQEISPSKMSNLTPKSWKNSSSTSWKEFSKRVASFLIGEANLELKPVDLSPAVCARYGWKSVGKCMLQCVACNVVLCSELPFPWNSTAYEECVKNIVESLKSSHKKYCPWFLAPSPDHFVRMHPMDKNEASSDLIDRTESLLTLEELPVIENDILSKLGITEKQIEALCQSSRLPISEYSKSVMVLALTGWSRSPSTEKKKYLWCSHCQRMVAMWFYSLVSPRNIRADKAHPISSPAESNQQNNSTNTKNETVLQTLSNNQICDDEKVLHRTEESDKLNQNYSPLELAEGKALNLKNNEETEETSSPLKKKLKMNLEDKLDLFNPLYEHRSWCMWISEGSHCSQNDGNENSRSLGWQIFQKSVLRGVESPFTSPEFIRPVSKEKVKKVRQMLENWS